MNYAMHDALTARAEKAERERDGALAAICAYIAARDHLDQTAVTHPGIEQAFDRHTIAVNGLRALVSTDTADA